MLEGGKITGGKASMMIFLPASGSISSHALAEVFKLPLCFHQIAVGLETALELLAPHLSQAVLLPCVGSPFQSASRGVSLAVEQVLYTDKVGGSIPSLRTSLLLPHLVRDDRHLTCVGISSGMF